MEINETVNNKNANFDRKEIYNKFVDKVFALCLRMLKNREAAKDASHQVFVKVFTNINQFRSESEIGTWIYRIAMNICLDQLRFEKKKFISINGENSPLDYHPYLTSQPKMPGPLEEVVRKILKTIDVEWAKTFWLFTMEQLSQKDIAEIQEISLPTVKMRLARVRKLLHEQLETKSYETSR